MRSIPKLEKEIDQLRLRLFKFKGKDKTKYVNIAIAVDTLNWVLGKHDIAPTDSLVLKD